jgi:hypothetical protein
MKLKSQREVLAYLSFSEKRFLSSSAAVDKLWCKGLIHLVGNGQWTLTSKGLDEVIKIRLKKENQQ